MSLLATAPALPLHTAGKYVAGAYIVFVVLLLVYLAIMGIRARNTERELAELRRELVARRDAPLDLEPEQDSEPVAS
jgi:hypothetical protein